MQTSQQAIRLISHLKSRQQYYTTQVNKQTFLGMNEHDVPRKVHWLKISQFEQLGRINSAPEISIKELVDRFTEVQSANWKNPSVTMASYKQWLRVFLVEHSDLKISQFTIEQFAKWKLSLKSQGYAAESINHFLSAVRAIFSFAEDIGLIKKPLRLKRVKNESMPPAGLREKLLYTPDDICKLLSNAGLQLKAMILLSLNCGFGPKDLHDLKWEDLDSERVTLPRTKTGVCQTYWLWPETRALLNEVHEKREARILEFSKRGQYRSDEGHIFITKFWRTWTKDAIAQEFKKLCKKAGVRCYGIYRMRHCASTAISMVASPHVQRRFMRHSQLQQQVTYTHIADAEVDKAVAKARLKLLGSDMSSSGR